MEATSRGAFVRCEECGQGFTQKSSLSRHTQAYHQLLKFDCCECGAKFTRKDSLTRHFKKAHLSGLHADAGGGGGVDYSDYL